MMGHGDPLSYLILSCVYISNCISQKVPAEIVETTKLCCSHKVQKPASPPLCFAHTTANHPATAHCGLTLIGDQKQTIMQAYTRPGKIAMASYTVNSHLTRPQTQRNHPQPCAFDTQLRVTHPLLELSLGCLAKQVLTASPLNFERSK